MKDSCVIFFLLLLTAACRPAPTSLNHEDYIRFLTHKIHYHNFYTDKPTPPYKVFEITKGRILTGDTLIFQNILQLEIKEAISIEEDSTRVYLYQLFFEGKRIYYRGNRIADGVLLDKENRIMHHKYGNYGFDDLYLVEELAGFTNEHFIRNIETTEHCNAWLRQYAQRNKTLLIDQDTTSMRSKLNKPPEFFYE